MGGRGQGFIVSGPRAGAVEKFGRCVVGVEGGANADWPGHARCAVCAVGWLCILYTRAAGLAAAQELSFAGSAFTSLVT